jgi:hypothetical protein
VNDVLSGLSQAARDALASMQQGTDATMRALEEIGAAECVGMDRRGVNIYWEWTLTPYGQELRSELVDGREAG